MGGAGALVLDLGLRVLFLLWLFHYTWTLFAAVMNARRVRDLGRLTLQARWMTLVALAIGYPLDALANLVFSAVLWEWPREILLSGRLWRLSNGPPGWRRDRAEWWRSRFLDWFDDRGVHQG